MLYIITLFITPPYYRLLLKGVSEIAFGINQSLLFLPSSLIHINHANVAFSDISILVNQSATKL